MWENGASFQVLLLLVAFLTLATLEKLAPFSTRVTRLCQISVIFLTTVLLWLTIPAAPTAQAMNGSYRNGCCEPIVLRDGVLITSTQKIPFKLKLMKYGLEAELARGIQIRNREVVNDPRDGSERILFDRDRRGFTVCEANCGPGHEYLFKRI